MILKTSFFPTEVSLPLESPMKWRGASGNSGMYSAVMDAKRFQVPSQGWCLLTFLGGCWSATWMSPEVSKWLVNGLNQLTNHLLSSWDIQVTVNWCFGFRGSPYKRTCYLGVPLESQSTNLNHQLTISWYYRHLKTKSQRKNPSSWKLHLSTNHFLGEMWVF